MCSITDCDRNAITRTWCKMHYQRWQRHGNPEQRTALPDLDTGFWDEVNIYRSERLQFRSATRSPIYGTLSAGVRI